MSEAQLGFTPELIRPPSTTFHCSGPWVSNPCKKKDFDENQIK